MLAIPDEDAVERSLRRATWEWLRLLSADHHAQAMAMLDEPNGYGDLWTWEFLQGVIQDAFRNHVTPPRVSDPEVAAGRDCFSLVRLADGSGYSVYVSLPLDGEWSDLTVQLEFLNRPQGLAMVLHDVHVM